MILYEIKSYFPIYLKLRFRGTSIQAYIVSNKLSKYGILPIVSYDINGVKYENITPIESGIATRSAFAEKKIIIYLDDNKPEQCVINSDFKVIIYAFLLVVFFTGLIYSLLK